MICFWWKWHIWTGMSENTSLTPFLPSRTIAWKVNPCASSCFLASRYMFGFSPETNFQRRFCLSFGERITSTPSPREKKETSPMRTRGCGETLFCSRTTASKSFWIVGILLWDCPANCVSDCLPHTYLLQRSKCLRCGWCLFWNCFPHRKHLYRWIPLLFPFFFISAEWHVQRFFWSTYSSVLS